MTTTQTHTYELKGFQFKKLKCKHKGCKSSAEPFEVILKLEVDTSTKPNKFRLIYHTPAPDVDGVKVTVSSEDLVYKTRTTSLARHVQKSLIGHISHDESRYMECPEHIALRKLRV